MQVTAIVGSYKKGGIVDNSVDEILAAAKTAGADVTKIYLIDKHIEFCCNCRACMQPEGPKRGDCSLADEMADILDQIERSDAIVLASPMNFGTVTAVMKRFIERLACYGYWPWETMAPKNRGGRKQKAKRAVVVASSAAPAFIARLSTQIVGLLKKCAGLLGAKRIDVLFIGLAAKQPAQAISEATRQRARHLGRKLVGQARGA
jgi:NAD(P)H-dependent FMN reductase